MRVFILVLAGLCACSQQVEKLQGDMRRVEDQLAVAQRSQAEISAKLEDMSNTIFILQDQVDTNRQYINSMKKNQAMQILQLSPTSLTDMARAEPTAVAPPGASPRVGSTPPPAVVSVMPAEASKVAAKHPAAAAVQPSAKIKDPMAFYREALGYYEAGQWQACIDNFERFARELPQHDYADNSLYWEGECFYSQNKFEEALQVFWRLVRAYPSGNKAPDALLKIALSYKALGDKRRTREALQHLLNQYPFSDAAAKAPGIIGKDG